MKPENYPISPPEGIFHFPQGVMCLIKQEDTGKESVKVIRISGDEFEFEITPKDCDINELKEELHVLESELDDCKYLPGGSQFGEKEFIEKKIEDKKTEIYEHENNIKVNKKLTEAEQKDFPIRVCKYEKQKEEDVEKEPKEIIKFEKRVDITKEVKQIVKIKDGEILKIGNTISYSAGTNLITLDDIPGGAGSSWGAAYDMDDVLSNCGAVVTKQGANAYDVSARMQFISGVYFVSKSEFVELRANPTNPAWSFRIDSGAHVQFGDYNSTDKYSYNGCRWDMPSLQSGTGNSASGNAIAGEFLVYGSKIITNTTSYTKGLQLIAGATVRYYNSLFKYCGYFWASDTDMQDVKWFGDGGSYDILAACALNHNWGGLTTMGCQKGIFFSATTTGNVDVYDFKPLNAGTDVFVSTGINAAWLVRVINSPLFVTCNTPGSGKRGVQRCYTFNVKVTNDQGTPIVGATVELKDVDGAVVFSEDTIAGGVLATDEIVKEYWFRHANDGGNKSYNDHTLKVTNGADETEYKIKIDHKITEDVVLIPQSVASYDNIMTAINDIKGTGFVKDTHSLKPILDDVTGLNGSAMIGTNGANTTTPPTTAAIKIELEAAGTKLTEVKTQTDKLHFSGDNVQGRVADKGVLNNPPSENIADYKNEMNEGELHGGLDSYANKAGYKATGFAAAVDMAYMLKIIKNKRELKKSGEVWSLIIYDDDNITSILTKELKDSTGANITDLAAGTLGMEIANSA